MATTKTRSAIWTGTSQSAGATTTSSAVDLADGYGAVLHMKVTNGGTGPTLPAQIQIETSDDNSAWYDFGSPFVALTGNSVVTDWGGVELPAGVKHVRLVGSGNTGQAVTLDAAVTEIVAVS